MLTERDQGTAAEVHALGLHGMRLGHRLIEVYRANKDRKDQWADRPKGWRTFVLENAEDGAEELVSRWVARDRAAILLQDGYHVWEPRVFREDMRARYGAYAGRAWAGMLDLMPVEEEPAAQEEQDPRATTAPMPPMPEEEGKECLCPRGRMSLSQGHIPNVSGSQTDFQIVPGSASSINPN